MQEQEKNKSSGMKAIMQGQRKQKGASILEQGKGISVHDEAKNSVRHVKGAKVAFGSDAERNLDGVRYRLGDMVWAKVKSHPWWPGQLYDPKLASASALELKRDSCFLVAFFGDSTFGWFAEAELIPFAPNFAQKSKQTSAHNFVDAVEDALDEVHRRVKVGLTCGCCISDSTSEEERKPGLLYDRQLHDVRNTFKPATLFAFMKDLACSPFSSSQNMLGSTIARAQADAFRLLASCKKTSEHGETRVVGDLVLSNQNRAQVPNDARIPEKSNNKYKVQKGITKKHVSSVQSLSQEEKDLNRIKSTNEKLRGLDKTDKAKQHSTSSSIKKGSTEKSKGSNGEKGGVKGTSVKSKGPLLAEDCVPDSRTMDATNSHKSLPSTDAFKERDLGGSGQNAALPENYQASTVLDESIQNDPSLAVRDSLASKQVKPTQTKPKKKLGGPTNNKIVKVSVVDAIESQAFSMKPMADVMKVKAMNADVGQLSKIKAVKKTKALNVGVEQVVKNVKVANADLDQVSNAKRMAELSKIKALNVGVEQVMKNVKVANADLDQVSKAKRMAEHDAIEGSDTFTVKVKKRKVSSESVCNNESDRSLKEDVGGSCASDFMMQQQVEEVMSSPIGLESDVRQPHIEPLVLMEANEDVSATYTSELDSEVMRLQQDETLQLTPEDSDALALLVTEPQFLKQGDQLEADHTAASSLQAENSADVSKKRKKKFKDLYTAKLLQPEGDVALMPLVPGAQPLKQDEQLKVEHKAIPFLPTKESADVITKKKKKPKDKASVQPSKLDGDDALVSFVERLKQGDKMGAEHKLGSSLQAKDFTDFGKKKKKKWKDTNTVESLNSEGNTGCLAKGDGKENAKIMETFSRVMEDQTSDDAYPSPLEVDSRLVDAGGIGSSFVSCGAVDALQDISQKAKEIPAVTYGHEEKTAVKEVKDSKGLPPFSKVTVSKKRVLEEKGQLSKDSSARSKKVKTLIMEGALECCEGFQGEDGAEKHKDSTKKRKESAHLQDLHDDFLSVAAKPPDSSKEDVFTAAQDSLASVKVVDVAVPEVSNRTGSENSKTLESAREQTEVSSKRGDHSFKVECSKVEDVRMEKESTQEVLGGNIATSSKLLKKSVSFSKKVSSSSVSLRPAIDFKIPVRGSKEILNRFGQRVPRQSDEAERLGNHPSRAKNASVERALMISFPQGFTLPSELQLAEVFAKFGDLNLPLTRIDSRSGCARIIFRRTQDAEAAFSSMKVKPAYQNARFWLKPRDADVGELPKQSSKYPSSSERPVLSRSNKLETKTASDKLGTRTAFDKRVPVSTENDIASDRHIQDRSSMPQNSSSRKAGASAKEAAHKSLQSNCGVMDAQPSRNSGASAKEGAHKSLQSNCGVMDAQPSRNSNASEKVPTGTSNAGHGSLEGVVTDHSNAAASSPSVGPRSLDTPNIDISEPFLALLHELHDLVLSMGFTF